MTAASASGPRPDGLRPDGLPDGLRVEADLRLEVDGVPVHVTGDGAVIRVHTDRPFAVARHGRDLLASLRTPIAGDRVGSVLDRTGLSVEFHTGRGVLLRLGGGRRRPSVRPGPAVVLPLAAGLGVLGALVAGAAIVLRRIRA